MENLNIITLNVKGFQTSKMKRQRLFRWCTEQYKPNVIFFQETHSSQLDEIIWAEEWGRKNYDIYFAHGDTKSRGVCIIISTNVSKEIHHIERCPRGRYIVIDITLSGRRMTLCNVYAPNKDDPQFMKDMFEKVDDIPNDDRIIAGDFNAILNENLDKAGGNEGHSNVKMAEAINSYIANSDVIDIWRFTHRNEKRYTYHCKWRGEHIFTRLDYFLVSFSLCQLVNSSEIKPSILTDHSLVSLDITISVQKRGRGYWKLNCSYLTDDEYVTMIRDLLQDLIENTNNLDPGSLWEFLKVMVRGATTEYATRKKRHRVNLLEVYRHRLSRLEHQFHENADIETENDINQIKSEIENLLEYEIRGREIRTKIKFLEEGEKPTKFFLTLEQRNFNKKNINRLRTSSGSDVTSAKDILSEIKTFYTDLYSKKTNTLNLEVNNLDNFIPTIKLSEGQRDTCEGPLTEEELAAALLTCKNDKSPGSDGLPSEFYRMFWNEIKTVLTNALNFAYQQSHLSLTQKEGIITLLPKKGKDPLLIKNWRPISLLNQDYKLATKVIARRIRNVLTYIINTDQTGFIKDRYIGENIVRLQNIMDFVDEENMPALVLNIDFEKAFDTVHWDFIAKSLQIFNFGPSIIKWVKTFYTDINSRVINNGHLSDKFEIYQGVRQGCPLSPYLFIICAEILAEMIRNDENIHGIRVDNKHYVISQYADDTILTILYEEKILTKVIEVFEDYTHFSGLRVNIEKTEVIPIGPIKYNHQIFEAHRGLKWSSGPIKVLGITLHHEHETTIQTNYNNALRKIKSSFEIWKRRKMSIFGKIVIINTFIISQLVYYMSVLPTPPTKLLKEIETLIFNFIWNGKKDKIKRQVLTQGRYKGGLAVPDLYIKNKALKIAWIKRILTENGKGLSPFLYRNLPMKTSDVWNFNLNVADASTFCCKLQNKFFRDVIQFWFEYTFKGLDETDSNENQYVLGNSLVRIGDKPIYLGNIASIDNFTIKTLLDVNGSKKTHLEYTQTYNEKINIVTYYGILAAIPRQWKMTRERTHTNKVLNELANTPKACKKVYEHIICKNSDMTEITGLKNGSVIFYNRYLRRNGWDQSNTCIILHNTMIC